MHNVIGRKVFGSCKTETLYSHVSRNKSLKFYYTLYQFLHFYKTELLTNVKVDDKPTRHSDI